MKAINKLSDIVYSLEKIVAIILASVLLVSLAGGVLFRYVFKSPLFWSDELAIFCLIWITFIGGSMGLKQKASPSITILKDLASPKIQKILNVLSNTVLLVFVGYVLYLAYNWLGSPNIMVQKSTAMNIPKIYFYLSIPISFIFMVIHVFNATLQSFTDVEEEGTER